ncbi:595_t:CDS:2 [Paraglomus occultum]|uniref:595_t:CDS:1 n=1 Tax=Paraglomus occultum TaxID=144539 RepID=A0A9N9FXD7_9GLOM|nr:595_t:CDS:2 [Paraglomus occultum]
MTIQETLNKLDKNAKNQTKNISFQYGNNQPNFSGETTLNIYDHDNRNTELLKGNLNLAQFPNLRKITFAYNLRVNSLENIDISENTNLNRKLEQLKKETEQTPTLRQFQELNNIALPTTELNFDNLKREVQRLKLKDFIPYFQEQRDNLDQLIDSTKNKVGENLEMFLELCLQTQKQISESEKEENDALTQAQLKGQLTAYQTILQTKLNKKEVKNLLEKQAEFTHLEKQLKILEQVQEEKTEAQIEQIIFPRKD